MVGSATMIRSSPSVTASGSQFSRLLASSRLASHSPVIPQTYTAPVANLARGDFGLKRSLPSRNKPNGSLRFVDVEALDTREGQTIWTEREHQVLLKKRLAELNVRISPLADIDEEVSLKGLLGPRISTTFDPSTRRSVPSAYNAVSDPNMRTHLQSEALQGRGPIYPKNIHAGNAMSVGLDIDGPFSSRAGAYTVQIPVPTAFRAMDEKRFEKYLDYIRSQRSAYRKRSTLRAAEKERQELIARYEKERQKVQNANRIMSESSTEQVPLTEPESLSGPKVPLPEITGDYTSKDDGASVGIDLWNESRTENVILGSLWESWLRERDELRASQAIDTALPNNPAPAPARESYAKIRNKPMHPSAGLQYGTPDLIQTRLLADAVPGRLLDRHDTRSSAYARSNRSTSDSQTISVAVGGQVATMPSRYIQNPRFIDWTQRDTQAGVRMIKPHGTAELEHGPKLSYASPDSLPIWSSRNGRSNRSASAASIVAQKAVEAVESESYQDSLRESSLPSQFGQLSMKVRPVDPEAKILSRGQPGSPQWVGQLDHKLAQRRGESETKPMLYGELDLSLPNAGQYERFMNESKESEQRSFEQTGRSPSYYKSPKGVGKEMYSKREIKNSYEQRRQASVRKKLSGGRTKSSTTSEESQASLRGLIKNTNSSASEE